jgi:hypothetical protein
MLIGIVGGFGMYVLDLDANVSADSPGALRQCFNCGSRVIEVLVAPARTSRLPDELFAGWAVCVQSPSCCSVGAGLQPLSHRTSVG